MVTGGWSSPPSFSRCFVHHTRSSIKKVLVPLRGTRTERQFCGTTLFVATKATTFVRCQHIGCPLTLAMRQKILRFPFSLCPPRPICCPASRPALSYAELSVDALTALLPLLKFPYSDDMPVIHYVCPFVKNFFSWRADINIPEPRLGRYPGSGHGCRQWVHSCHFPA